MNSRDLSDFYGFTVGIVGLGLIGGSMAKAVKQYTACRIVGADRNPAVEQSALDSGIIDKNACEDYSGCDIILIGLYPHHAVDFIKKHRQSFSPGAVVVDLCGIKDFVCLQAKSLLDGTGVYFVGGHPMAGTEASGFENSFAELFAGASMILTPGPDIPREILDLLSCFFMRLGFGHIELTDSENHDRIIAYTSQLAHVMSSAYMKSPTAGCHMGFSAGSFRDLTRVAKLNPDMWTELFLLNQEPLCREIDCIIENLTLYRNAIQTGDEQTLRRILREGSDIKEKLTLAEKERRAAWQKDGPSDF